MGASRQPQSPPARAQKRHSVTHLRVRVVGVPGKRRAVDNCGGGCAKAVFEADWRLDAGALAGWQSVRCTESRRLRTQNARCTCHKHRHPWGSVCKLSIDAVSTMSAVGIQGTPHSLAVSSVLASPPLLLTDGSSVLAGTLTRTAPKSSFPSCLADVHDQKVLTVYCLSAAVITCPAVPHSQAMGG